MNAKYFNDEKGIYSKCEIEDNIPDKWKLQSYIIESNLSITDQKNKILSRMSLPVFFKPEWGQNSHGIFVVETEKELVRRLKQIKKDNISYIYQETSQYQNEYEVLYTRDPIQPHMITLQSMVEAKPSEASKYPINGIYCNTTYHDISDKWSETQKERFRWYMKEIWDFNIARVWIKSHSLQDLKDWIFEIFEINIFIPFPLHLLDKNILQIEKNKFLKKFTKSLALLTSHIPKENNKSIFFRKIFTHYKIKLNNNKSFMKIKKLIYKFIEDKFLHGCSDYNSLEVRKLCRSKKQAREMFQKYDVPHAKGSIFYNPYTAYKFVQQHWFPVVLKPNVWGYSRGSFFPITNYKDFWKAMFFVKLWWPSSVIEQYLLWKNYRVVVTKWSVDIVMERYPGFVIWDGKKTVSRLIDEENKEREKMNLIPVIHTIEKWSRVKNHMKQFGYHFDSILEKGKKLTMYHRVSLAPGGVLETVGVETITEKNKEIFFKILDAFGANVFGIDVIMEKGIDVDFDKQECIFLEVNSRPYLEMHNYPRYWEKPDMKPLYEKLDALDITWRGIY